MSKKLFTAWIIASMILALFSSALTAGPLEPVGKSVSQIGLFQSTKFDAHYRTPNIAQAQHILEEEGVLLKGASMARVQTAAKEFMGEFAKRNPDTPAPAKLRELLKGEKKGAKKVVAESPIKSLVVPVEFPNTTTFDWCGTTVTQTGPLHNQIAPPGPRDNNSIWYEDTSVELYDELYFGQGPQAGVIVNHPSLGAVDLRGNTMANYYLEQSEGRFVPAGLIYPKWLQASKAEGYYGQDSCDGSSHNTKAGELVIEVLEAVKADSPDFDWQSFDGDGNGIVDNFTVIHAGAGQEGGGGAQGDFAIWSHASLVGWPTGYKVCSAGSAGCPSRDIFVREYSMDPENIDIGVIAEEFGHAAFGLPDLYTTDYDAAISNWAIMESGSWNGPLAGMQPAPFPLWFRMLVGWAEPVEVDYTETGQFRVGQLSLRPKNTEYGLRINLPDKLVEYTNPLNTGNAFWSNVGDLMISTIMHEFDLTSAQAPVFSFNSFWSLETDYDGGYVEISDDGGATWVALKDEGGFMTQNTLNENNPDGKWVLTGEGQGVLTFNLAAYAGKTVQIRLAYVTDMAVQFKGWWGDDFTLVDGAATLFSDDVSNGLGDWVSDGWMVVPLSKTFERYYLVEWRNSSGFDRGLQYPYSTVYYDDDEWQVDRGPYTVPGMLVYFRDASYALDYTLLDSLYDPPSLGPKHGLVLVDSHSFPLVWEAEYATGAKMRINQRLQASNAAFTLQETTPFTLNRVLSTAIGEIVETKTFGPQPAVSQFHDSLGYFPGYYFNGDGYLYWRDRGASAVLPAKGNYTTRITDVDGNLLYDFFGIDIGDTILGTGNPGDDGVQFGLHLAVTDKAKNGSWGAIKMWNSPALVSVQNTVTRTEAKAGTAIKYTIRMKNLTPANQKVSVFAPVPAEVTYKGPLAFYNADTHSVQWKGTLPPYATRVVAYVVRINAGVPVGTIIINESFITDDALGASASVQTTVIK